MQKLTAIGTVGKKILVNPQETYTKINFWLNVKESSLNRNTGEVKESITSLACLVYVKNENKDELVRNLKPGAAVFVVGVARPFLQEKEGAQYPFIAVESSLVRVLSSTALSGHCLFMDMLGNIGNVRTNTEREGDVVCNFSLAHNEGYKDKQEVIWTNCSLWRAKDKCSVFNYLEKGKKVYVQGRPRASMYTTGDGSVNVSLEMNVQRLELVSGGRSTEETPEPELPADPAPASSSGPNLPDFGANDLPF